MHNFTHDIPMPGDKAILKFLWISYFHDALIQEIQPGKPTPQDLTLRIYSGHDGYTYLLRFHGAEHFECSGISFWHAGLEIASTVFKDTALLHRCQAAAEKPLYHLRFSLWDGYLDVVFAKFTIRREGGRVNYKPEFDPAVMNWDVFCYAPNGYWLKNDPFLVDLEHPEGDDADEQTEWIDDILWARLDHFHQADNECSYLCLARELLATPPRYEHAALYAAYLLGKSGDTKDLPALTTYCLHEETPIRKRVILDAIELIQERNK